MKHCPTCKRTYSDDTLLFCADDGTQLVSDGSGGPEPNRPPSDSQPTLIAPAQFTPPAAAYDTAPKKRKWLAVIALVLGIFALPFLLYSLVQEMVWEYGFRNLSIDRLFLSIWGFVTIFAVLLVGLSVIVALVAIILSIRKPAQYGGRLLALAGPLISVCLLLVVIGAFAFRRMQGSTYEIFNSNSNSNINSNYNSRSSPNDNAASNSNDNANSSSATPDASDMSETEKYRLFYAAAKSGDTDLQQRAARKIGIVDSSGMPTSTYQSFIKGTIKWAFEDRAWVRSMDTPEKGRAYALERL